MTRNNGRFLAAALAAVAAWTLQPARAQSLSAGAAPAPAFQGLGASGAAGLSALPALPAALPMTGAPLLPSLAPLSPMQGLVSLAADARHPVEAAPHPGPAEPADLGERIKAKNVFVKAFREEFARHIVGHAEVGQAMLLALLSGGHVLLEGLPGSAKTRSVVVFSAMLGLSAGRIQFTRDMQPFDVTGQEELDRETQAWEVRAGPGLRFHIVLYDEVNRAKGQTQAGSLQVMEEGHATIAGKRVEAPQPHMVAATENPIEEDGVYPLPRAMKDRFMFYVRVPYLGEEGIVKMLDVVLDERQLKVAPVATEADILEAIELTRTVKVSQEIKRYIARLIVGTRPAESRVDSVKKWVQYGASDRAAKVLARAAQAHAFVNGRAAVLPEDVQAVAHWVLDHRLILNYRAEGATSVEKVVGDALSGVPAVVSR